MRIQELFSTADSPRARLVARGIVAVLLSSLVVTVLPAPQVNAAPACVEGTHYSRTTNSGGFPITYTFTSTSVCTWTVPSGLNKGDFILVGGGGEIGRAHV